MATATTRRPEYSKAAPALNLAFRLGELTWNLALTTGLGQPPRERTIPARDRAALEREIPREAALRACRHRPGTELL